MLARSGSRGIYGVALAAGGSARAALWYVPDAPHARALERHPDRYRARVLAFPGSAVQR